MGNNPPVYQPRNSFVLLALLAGWLGAFNLAPVSGAAAIPTRTAHFELPVTGMAWVLTPFRLPTNRYGPGHRGVDLGAIPGSHIRAAAAGTVIFAGALAGRGVVSISHGAGIRTTYEPVTAVVVTGEVVAAGEVIGVLQSGHSSCAPATCLHWGARLADGSYLDPMGLITGLKVRLLPWAP